jgi:hypothetical protein
LWHRETGVEQGYFIFDLGALQGGSAGADKLHQSAARNRVRRGKVSRRGEYLAEAQKLGASQRQSAKAIGMSPAWVSALQRWQRSGYGLHPPLNRQSNVYAREGIDLDVSRLADRVGACAATLMPLVETIRGRVFAAERTHADDTTVPVLAKGKTRTGRLWTYVRDDGPFGGFDPPAAAFFYSRDRAGEHPERHLASYAGLVRADAYAGFNRLYGATRKPGPIVEAACWAHARRKSYTLSRPPRSTASIHRHPSAANSRWSDARASWPHRRSRRARAAPFRDACRRNPARPFSSIKRSAALGPHSPSALEVNLTLEINSLTRRLNPRRNIDFRLQLNHLSVLHSLMSIADERSRRPFAGGDASRTPRSHPGSLVTVQSAENRELGR